MEIGLVVENGAAHRDADCAAEIAHHVEKAARVFKALRRQAAEAEIYCGRHCEGLREAAQDLRDQQLAAAPVAGDVAVGPHRRLEDPYMRGRVDDQKSYATPVRLGDVMGGEAVARVLVSNRATGTAPRTEAARKLVSGSRFLQAGSRSNAVCHWAERRKLFGGQEMLSHLCFRWFSALPLAPGPPHGPVEPARGRRKCSRPAPRRA